MKTREQYMSNEVTHSEYYGQFVTPSMRKIVESALGLEDLLSSIDPHFNNIPLEKWDAMASGFQPYLSRKLREAGDSWSLSGSVCTLKEAARQIVERAKVAA